jgi:hypothetical protein
MKLRQEYFCPSNKEGLLRYLLVKTSPVMMKVKPAMLVRISNCFRAREFQPYDIFCMHQKTILETLAVDYVIMKNNGSDIQVLFYDREVLENTLKNDRVKSFLKEFNYRDEWSVSECLDELRSRFSSSDFPHEIGIFLGYPLEDVRGFISDYSSGISVPQGRWRIYGDIAKSLKTMTLYRHAEELGKIIIKDYHDVSICIEKIRNSVITEQIELGT